MKQASLLSADVHTRHCEAPAFACTTSQDEPLTVQAVKIAIIPSSNVHFLQVTKKATWQMRWLPPHKMMRRLLFFDVTVLLLSYSLQWWTGRKHGFHNSLRPSQPLSDSIGQEVGSKRLLFEWWPFLENVGEPGCRQVNRRHHQLQL